MENSVFLVILFYSICTLTEGRKENRSIGVHEDAFLLITSGKNYILRMDPITGSKSKITMTSQLDFPIEVDYDPVEERIYCSASGAIFSSLIDGSDVRTFTPTDNVVGLAIDAVSRLLFYTDYAYRNSQIVMMSMKTWESRTVINSNIVNPNDIVLDTYKWEMFWTNAVGNGKIERANYDGSDRRIIVSFNTLIVIDSLALDAKTDQLYWVAKDKVETCKTDGRERRTLFQLPSTSDDYRMDLYAGSLYIIDTGVDAVDTKESLLMRYEIGGKNWTVFGRDESLLTGVHAHYPGLLNKGPNGCGNNNGGCTAFCIPLPGNSSKCLRAEGHSLTSTNTSVPGSNVTTSCQTYNIAVIVGVTAGGTAIFIITIVVIIAVVLICRKKPPL